MDSKNDLFIDLDLQRNKVKKICVKYVVNGKWEKFIIPYDELHKYLKDYKEELWKS